MTTNPSAETVATMDPETLEALKGSIAKWERVVEEGKDGTNWGDCPLCGLFYSKACTGCPVRNRTGMRLCSGSPFDEYSDLLLSLQDDDETGESNFGKHPGVIAAARAELDFLKSLLPSNAT